MNRSYLVDREPKRKNHASFRSDRKKYDKESKSTTKKDDEQNERVLPVAYHTRGLVVGGRVHIRLLRISTVARIGGDADQYF
jgi:hypothetical protein